MTCGVVRLADSQIGKLIGIIDLPAASEVFGDHNQPCIGKLLNGFADRACHNSTGRDDRLLARIAPTFSVSAFAEIAVNIKRNG